MGINAKVRRVFQADGGQMSVELAVVLPVALVVVLVAVNIFYFLEASSKFGQLAPKAIIFCAVDDLAGGGVEQAITKEIERGMGENYRVSVVTTLKETSKTALFLGEKQTYVCEMKYTPWPAPRTITIAGASTGALTVLRQRLTFTIDSPSAEVLF